MILPQIEPLLEWRRVKFLPVSCGIFLNSFKIYQNQVFSKVLLAKLQALSRWKLYASDLNVRKKWWWSVVLFYWLMKQLQKEKKFFLSSLLCSSIFILVLSLSPYHPVNVARFTDTLNHTYTTLLWPRGLHNHTLHLVVSHPTHTMWMIPCCPFSFIITFWCW